MKNRKHIFILLGIIFISTLIFNKLFIYNSNLGYWYRDAISLRENQTNGLTGDNVKIAIIDTGYKYFNENTESYFDFTAITPTGDINGHGTIMHAFIEEISPEATIIDMKIMDQNGMINSDNLILALEKAHELDVDIVNLSLGTHNPIPEVDILLEKMLEDGIIVVTSIGDYGESVSLYPANKENVISVGAIDKFKVEWEFNNNIGNNEILFPGVDVNVYDIDGRQKTSSGTSYSTAILTGYIAQLLSYNESCTNEQLINLISEFANNNYLINTSQNCESY